MKNKYIESYIFYLFLLFCGCANIVPPNGGEKDTSAPKLVSATPANKSVFFNSNKAILKFDEYIQLKNVNLIQMSPGCGEKVNISQKGKQIEIAFSCVLDTNTTYSINFGNSIIDLNEGNELKNFKYIFSTGPALDSLSIKGKVRQLYNNNSDIIALVALYKDTIDAPYYYTFSDGNGKFKLENIKNGNYTLYAIIDENGNLRYDSGELNSFPRDIFKLDTIIDVGLFYNHNNPEIREIKNSCRNSIEFQHNKIQDSIFVLNKAGWWDSGEESSVFWFNESSDAVKYEFDNYVDSVEIYNTDSTKIDLKVYNSIGEIRKLNTISIKSNKPIKSINDSLFRWKSRDLAVLPTIKDPFRIDIPIEFDVENKEENLIIYKGAILDVFGLKNDSLDFNFDFNNSHYGKLTIHNTSPKSIKDNYVIELYQKSNIIRKKPLLDSVFMNFITPGKYYIRVFNDINNDFFWDTGSVEKNKKPEPIYVYPESIEIKSNWEIDIELKPKKHIY